VNQWTLVAEVLRGGSWKQVAPAAQFGSVLTGVGAISGRTYLASATTGAYIQISETGYYRFSVCQSDIVDGIDFLVEIAVLQNHSYNSISAMPGILNKASTIRSLRVLAHSTMLSPYANAMFRGGRCGGRQLETGLAWWQTPLDADSLASLNGGVDRPFDKGIYGFAKPDCDHCFAMNPLSSFPSIGINASMVGAQTFTTTDLRTFSELYNPIYPPGGWLIVAAEVPQGDLSTTAYPDGRVHVSNFWAVEFQTADVWSYARVPVAAPGDYDVAVTALRRVPAFWDNPTHVRDIIKDILGLFGRGARMLWRASPALLAAISAVQPEAAPLAVPMGAAITAAQAAGFRSKQKAKGDGGGAQKPKLKHEHANAHKAVALPPGKKWVQKTVLAAELASAAKEAASDLKRERKARSKSQKR